LDVYVGEFIQSGQPRMALVSKDSFWVYGYFEENRLQGIHIGSAAEVTLMGSNTVLKGKVESIARGITDRDNPSSKSLLADVNPSFSWVRLAQRVPVRIALDSVPDNIQLVSGMSCSISVK
jgi:p-hydroxybenzoic acid efflux pump subunit AaeA